MYTIHPCYLWRAVAVGVGSLGRWAAARCHSVKGRGAKAGTSRHLGRALVRPASLDTIQYSTVQYSTTTHWLHYLLELQTKVHEDYSKFYNHGEGRRRFVLMGNQEKAFSSCLLHKYEPSCRPSFEALLDTLSTLSIVSIVSTHQRH